MLSRIQVIRETYRVIRNESSLSFRTRWFSFFFFFFFSFKIYEKIFVKLFSSLLKLIARYFSTKFSLFFLFPYFLTSLIILNFKKKRLYYSWFTYKSSFFSNTQRKTIKHTLQIYPNFFDKRRDTSTRSNLNIV